MNSELIKLYESKWTLLSKELGEINNDSTKEVKPANPLLLSVDNEFVNSDIKIMFIGQETNGWYESISSIEELTKAYDDFYWSNRCYKRGGQFWNGVKLLKTLVQDKYPNKNISAIWNNVLKIGKAKGKNKPPQYIRSIEHDYFKVIQEELKIIKPNVIIFLSGPYYDNIISEHFQVDKYAIDESVSVRKLARLEIKGYKNCFRTYHPNNLYRSKNINQYFDAIVKEIKID